MMNLSNTVEQIKSDADYTEFAECYARELGMNIGRGLRYSEIQRIVDCSPRTISKVKKMMGEVS